MRPALLLVPMLLLLLTACPRGPQGSGRYGPAVDHKAALDKPAADTSGQVAERPDYHAARVNWAGTIDSACTEAQGMDGHQKVFVLITDTTCPDCVRYETEYLTAPEVIREATDRWLFVKVDVRSDPGPLERYKITREELPVVVFVSEAGNENGRIAKLPSTPTVLARIMSDKF